MKQIKNDISVYIQNVAAHKFMKDKLLNLVNDCPSNSLDNVSNTDWHESNIERKYWDCFYSMIEPYLENLCLRLNKEKFTGCTVHYVNKLLDSGKIIIQERISLKKKDTVQSIKKKVLKLEHKIYPIAIKKVLITL